MRITLHRLLIMVALYLSAGALQASEIIIEDAWVRAMPPGSRVSAAYASIINHGIEADVLTAVETPTTARTELHRTEIRNDMVKMEAIDWLELPAGQTTPLQPGGVHIMLRNLDDMVLIPGTTVELLFRFRNAPPLRVEAEVRTGTHSHARHHH